VNRYESVSGKASGELIGFNGLKFLEELQAVELGYRLVPRCWGRGLATEGALAAIDYGFRVLRLPRLLGLVHPENTRSVRVLEKCGFALDGQFEYHGTATLRYLLAMSNRKVPEEETC
jgi:RimJ/RimL family protein N-acetyltransferase